MPVEAVALTPSLGDSLGISPSGTNSFGRLRFAIPYITGFQGHALFLDGSDMLVRGDLAELWAMRDPFKAVQVVKHDYKTAHPRKYIGTELEADNEDYPRKNWSSVVLWNCVSWKNRLTPQVIDSAPISELHRFNWLRDEDIGELPAEWNHIPQEFPENPSAKIVHYSLGIPGFSYYAGAEHSAEWKNTLRRAQRGL